MLLKLLLNVCSLSLFAGRILIFHGHHKCRMKDRTPMNLAPIDGNQRRTYPLSCLFSIHIHDYVYFCRQLYLFSKIRSGYHWQQFCFYVFLDLGACAYFSHHETKLWNWIAGQQIRCLGKENSTLYLGSNYNEAFEK